jgi:phosphoribosylformimino-5-aminoimidazole carboxamide ribotide isomerase
MIVLPAVDILDGKAVRLVGGEFDAQTVYDADPLDAATRWVEQGARGLHVVDLDGARTGTPANLEHVRRIAAAVEVPVQVGGGLRTGDAVNNAFDAGATRVVLGTAAYRDIDFIDDVLAEHGNCVVVSTDIPVESVVATLGARGVRRFVYSSIERDGRLSGPDLEGAETIAQAVRGSFVYSGGVSSLDDLRALAALRQVNMTGVIVGKALYEQRFTVGEAQSALGTD